MRNVIDEISCKLSLWCDEDGTEEEREILTYGFNLILESAYKFLVLFLIAFFTHTVFETLIIIGNFCILKYFAGGVHCKTSIGCTSCMLIVWMSGLAAGYFKLNTVIDIAMLLASIAIVAWLAPCSTNNNPINDIKIMKKKHTGAVITVCIQTIILITVILLGRISVAGFIAVPVFIEAITLIPLRKGEIHMKGLKEMLKSIGNNTAYNSVGKSIPIICYEPKMPETLRKKEVDAKKEK